MQDNFTKDNSIAEKSVSYLIDQCFTAHKQTHQLTFDQKYHNINNIVVCGMGGSSFPSHIVSSLYKLKTPFIINKNYDIPIWADEKTLVILSSYSGNTEEVLNCAQQARTNNCLIIGITTGGKLKNFLEDNKLPAYIFDQKYNPSLLPRFGVGYEIFGLLGILLKLDLIKNATSSDLDYDFNNSIKKLSFEIKNIRAFASNLAQSCAEKNICVFSSGHLNGNGHIMINQLNETSKALSFLAVIPEADHNLILGFTKKQDKQIAVFLESLHYSNKIKARFEITKKILKQNNNTAYSFEAPSGSQLQEVLAVLLFSSYFSIELAIKNKVDPLECDILAKIKEYLLLTT